MQEAYPSIYTHKNQAFKPRNPVDFHPTLHCRLLSRIHPCWGFASLFLIPRVLGLIQVSLLFLVMWLCDPLGFPSSWSFFGTLTALNSAIAFHSSSCLVRSQKNPTQPFSKPLLKETCIHFSIKWWQGHFNSCVFWKCASIINERVNTVRKMFFKLRCFKLWKNAHN